MSEHESEPEHRDVEDWYDELEGAAQDARATDPASRETQQQLRSIDQALSSMDRIANTAAADKLCKATARDDEGFADASDTASYDALARRAESVAAAATPDRLQQVREVFLATEFGYVASDRDGATADSMLMSLHRVLAGQPSGLTGEAARTVEALAGAWAAADGPTLWERLAQTYSVSFASGPDLGDHMIRMSLVSELRKPDEREGWLWDSQEVPLELVEELIGGQLPGFPVDVSQIYRRAGSLTVDGTPAPDAVKAELVRLALAALAGDPVGGATAPRNPTLDALAMLASSAEVAAQSDLLKYTSGMKGDGAVEVEAARALAAGYDLGASWDRAYHRLRVRLLREQDGAQRAAALDAVTGEVTRQLSEWSRLRRQGAGSDELLKVAYDVSRAFDSVRQGIRSMLGDDPTLRRYKELESETALLIGPVAAFQGEFSREVRCVSAGVAEAHGRFDAPMFALSEGTLANQARARLLAMKTGPDATGIAATAWAQSLAAPMEAWNQAKMFGPISNRARDLAAAGQRVLKALPACRAEIAKLSPADRSRWTLVLDSNLNAMADWVAAASTIVADPVMGPSVASLEAQLRASVTKPVVVRDVAQLWRKSKTSLDEQLRKASLRRPNFTLSFGDTLKGWQREADRHPVDQDKLEKATWAVVDVLQEYRPKIEHTVADPNVRATYLSTLDTIAETVIARLQAVGH